MINYPQNIEQSTLSIYDAIDPTNPNLYIPIEELEVILSNALIGLSLAGYPLRTRSKIVKVAVCQALGYPIPQSFRKTRPRFFGQNFDVYTQKSLNVQIWNEDIDAFRRYVFFRIGEDDTITAVKVIRGAELAQYDRTGTLTIKYQATMTSRGENICSPNDSETVENWIVNTNDSICAASPNDFPINTQLLRITEIYRRLQPIVGQSIAYHNAVQERTRGAALHDMICQYLGYSIYEDNGTYPDIFHQLLEIKLQTSPTIDLGLHSPADHEVIVSIDHTIFYSEDIRYAIFDGEVQEDRVILRNLYLVTGKDFTSYFPLFGGGGTNSKIQLPLPYDFFN
ncbi:restriction endonuclease [Akkermansia glycaniphila]|uniref:restriction endonuclease n=1 Tax=Akkermansia glycaniphila TaxID=1679444 RepID=UPI001C021B74|nr:restriction endonuclease [Akkermansia glycaniphila]MBT9450700.1 restriction endonuclease [Akkermansia glycaniphila]